MIAAKWTKRAAVLSALLLPLLAGCKTSSQWQFVRHGQTVKITTKVIVRTEPSGAEISINGKYIGVAPLEVPIRYVKTSKIYSRRNYAPPSVEERELPGYEKNEYRLGAYKVGFYAVEKEINLKGEESLEFSFTLKKRPN